MNKSCNHCGRFTYKIKPWHTSPSEQIEHVCTGCNFNEEDCQCPQFISGISPMIPSVTEHYSPNEDAPPVPNGWPLKLLDLEHDDESPRE